MKLRILIIEDSDTVARVLTQIAENNGFEVVHAKTFAETREKIAENDNFFVATIDYNLPDAVNGEVLPYVMEHSIPGIVLTGKLDEKTRTDVLTYPVVDYVPKENAQSLAYINRLLQRLIANQHVRVLVVDDSKPARQVVTRMLLRHNFLIAEASNGVEALQRMKDYADIQMVITDAEMPVMNGIQLVNELRKNHDKDTLAIIGISSHGDGSLSARFIKNGANDFLTKPFYNEEFYCRVMQNIEHIENIEKIRRAANIDWLTNLPNRRYFFHSAAKLIEQQDVSVAMVDIDHFKQINDTFGHDVGDTVIKEVARRLQRHFPDDLVARFGGEEFCLLLSSMSFEDAIGRVEFLRRHIESKPCIHEVLEVETTVSIGLATGPFSVEKLITLADERLYDAKQTGRNKVVSS